MLNEHMELLKKQEGFREKAYWDSEGKLTIGYGTNLEDRGISKCEAEILLENDVSAIENQLSKQCSWFKDLSAIRRGVLVNMAYNLGVEKFFTFRKFLRCLQENQWEAAANEMLESKWNTQVGQRAEKLAEIMRTNTL